MKDLPVVICMPWGAHTFSGSVKMACAKCAAEIAVSPTSMAMEGARLICIGCTPRTGMASVSVAPGGMDEIERERGPEERQRAERLLREINRR